MKKQYNNFSATLKIKMASISCSSISAVFFPVCNNSYISSGNQLFFPASESPSLKYSRFSASRIFSVPQALESNADSASLQVVPKQKTQIKLRSYWVPLIEDSCEQKMDAARTTNAKTMGPVPLPTKKRVYCVVKSPHAHKDARFHFEIRTHQRLIDVLYSTSQTIDLLMQLDLPAGVDVEVKLQMIL